MARVHIFQGDPFVTFAERIGDDNDYSDWYEIPDELIAEHEAAEARHQATLSAIQAHIADNKLTAHEATY